MAGSGYENAVTKEPDLSLKSEAKQAEEPDDFKVLSNDVEPATNAKASGSDVHFEPVNINSCHIAAYRQFPGMYPRVAHTIIQNAPYRDVADIYNIPNLEQMAKATIQKYEAHFFAGVTSPCDSDDEP